MEITEMTLEDLDAMKDTLYSDFDNFWSYNVLKQELEILESLIDLCADLNVKSFTLEVNVNNTPAINLYEKFGFKNLGIRKKYYNNATDAIIMTKYDL